MCTGLQAQLPFPGPKPALLPEAWDPLESVVLWGKVCHGSPEGWDPVPQTPSLSAADGSWRPSDNLSILTLIWSSGVTPRDENLSLLTHWVERCHRGKSCAHLERSECPV